MATDYTKPNPLKIFVAIMICGGLAFVFGQSMKTLVDKSLQGEIMEKGAATTGRVADLKTRDHEISVRYDVVDAGKNLYRIPVARAMELEAQSPWRKNYVPAATPAPTPAAAPAPGAQPTPAGANGAAPTPAMATPAPEATPAMTPATKPPRQAGTVPMGRRNTNRPAKRGNAQ